MAEAVRLAELGRGWVEPNPMVGAVIVRDGGQVAAGYHRRFGGSHAEIEALRAAREHGAEVAGATMYVSLEPCCHSGKTPPCTDAIIAARLARVVVAMRDPDAKVSGRGIEVLRAAGVRVDLGVGQKEARRLLAAYVKLREQGRPWVICKWAQTSDGFLALPPSAGRWISGEESRQFVHRLRGEVDGILVGIGTVLADDPLLTNRSGTGKQPARVVLDSMLRLPPESQLANSVAVSQVIAAATAAGLAQAGETAERLGRKGVNILAVPAAGRGDVELPALLDELGRRQWTYLLVEGGPAVLAAFIDAHLADELLVFVSASKAPPGGRDLPHFDVAELHTRLGLGPGRAVRLGSDTLLRWVLNG
jgi:diaminohydroxyphosphoribosylaminopyrimidine deaminase/5-amino-6-(5-phosphoribosylamino)uracil reductase